MAIDKPLLQALLLTIAAGIADAVGYIIMGGVFAANMTGNTVLAGIAAAEGFYDLAAKYPKLQAGGQNPFIDHAGYLAYIDLKEKQFKDEFERQKKAAK